jgi:thiamine transport system substrate-binding protein
MRRFSIGLLLLLLAACGGQPSGAAPTNAPAATSAPAPAAAPTVAEAPAATAAPAVAPTAAAPAPTAAAAPAGDLPTLTLMTHDSFSVSEDVLKEFEQQEKVHVQVLKSGDAGSALNKAILSKSSPLADVFFGVDNTFLSRALKADIFEAYAAPALASIPDRFKLDSANTLLPIDYGYVNINYDKAFLSTNKLAAPTKLEDLAKPEWKGKLVVENPASSSPGLAFMLATIAQFGTSGSYTWLDYWKDLRANDVLVSDSWDDAYYTHFSGSSGKGPRPLVVSYATSPAAELVFSEADPKPTEPPTGNLLAGSFLQVEFAGILKGTRQRGLAERLIDFMLSKRFQEDVPLQMFVYPVQPEAGQPDVFKQFAQVPEQPAGLPPDQIDQNREQWLDAWTKAVVR